MGNLKSLLWEDLKIANFNSAKTFKITNSQTLISANISSFTVFWECRMVQKLWKKLKEIVLEQNISSELNIMDAFLGISASNLVNLICVVVKQYIYFCRCKNITPIVEVMLNRIKEVKNIEYKIASVNDTVTKHSKKWTLII